MILCDTLSVYRNASGEAVDRRLAELGVVLPLHLARRVTEVPLYVPAELRSSPAGRV